METRTAVSAGGVIVDPEGRVVLIAWRSPRGELRWGLPKGAIERGEDPPTAAAREAGEETGLEVEVVSPLPTIDYWYVQSSPRARVHKFVHYYLMRPVGGDPSRHDSETEQVAFVDPEEALERVSYRSERSVIRAAIEAAKDVLGREIG